MSDDFRPAFMDLATLSRHVCLSEQTIENQVARGIFPRPRMQGGKRLWSWRKVQAHLEGECDGPVDELAAIRERTRAEMMR